MNIKPSVHPSIFNDVMGPVMRGPSSSHTAASWRIAATCLELMGEPIDSALVEFDKDGIWASNYEDQGTVLGMSGGLLKIDMTDDKITKYEEIARREGISIEYKISSFLTNHPNTVRLTLHGKSGSKMEFVAVSTGGGMFEVRSVQNFGVTIAGDYHELLIFIGRLINPSELENLKSALSPDVKILTTEYHGKNLLQVKSSRPFIPSLQKKISDIFGGDNISMATASPVLPVISGNEPGSNFTSIESMLEYSTRKGLSVGNLGIEYEQSRSGLEAGRLIELMEAIIGTVEESIKRGLEGTDYKDRILHRQSHLIAEAEKASKIQTDPLVNSIIANITAIMEAKSSMETIVAIPTAGSCGTFGGTIKAYSDRLGASADSKVRAYFAGGLIGVLFARGPGFSAEKCGCQVETGIASAMTAAALVELSGGTAKQAFSAASMAMQNLIGLVCDPVADRVEVPCLGKNISAGMNALASHAMALAGYDQVIPLNEVIDTVETVGNLLPASLRCTGKGGLAVTPTSVDLKKGLSLLKQ